MAATQSREALDRLHRDLGFRRLSPWWAKLEIALGLVAVVFALFAGMRLAEAEARLNTGPDWGAWVAWAVVFVLGGYLALAGHRSHLYQSSNRLAAHLAELIRRHPPTEPRDHP